MKKKHCIKVGGIILAGIVACSLIGSGGKTIKREVVSAETTEISQTFDETDIRLTFASMSDSHIGYTQQQTNNFRRALNYVKTHYEVDALYFHGDQTQDGTEAQAKQFISIVKEFYDPTETAVVITNGNHDTYWSGCMTEKGFYDAYGPEVYTFDKDLAAAQSGNRHVVVNGYHFLSVNIDSYLGQNGFDRITEETKAWVSSTLAEIAKEDAEAPIFVSSHSPQVNTIWGSEYDFAMGKWSSTDVFDDLLGNYPQAILFSGHSHMAINDERAINQTSYTQIHAGSTSDADIDIGSTSVAGVEDRRSYSNGMIVEVDGEGNIRVTRLDFKKASVIKQPWIIPAPKKDGSHLNIYNAEAREARNTAPVLSDSLEAYFRSPNEFRVSFPKAEDDDMVFKYTIKILKDGKEAATASFYSPFIDYPDLNELPETVEYTFSSFTAARPFTVEISASDSFGKVSVPLIKEIADTTEKDKAAAKAFDEAVTALGEKEKLTENSLSTVQAVRSTYNSCDYYVKQYITKYEDFIALESYFYSKFYLAEDAKKFAPEAKDFYSLASTSSKGNASDSEYAGIKLSWNNATKNQLLGAKKGYRLDGLHMSFTNLSFSSENRKLGILLSNTERSKYLEGQNLVIFVDFSNGKIYANDSVSVGESKLLVEDSLSVTPFDVKFSVTETGDIEMLVHTMTGEEKITLSSSQFSDTLDTGKEVFVSFSPWDSATTVSLELTAIHDGECYSEEPVSPEPPDDSSSSDEPNEEDSSSGGCGSSVSCAAGAALFLFFGAMSLKKKRS